MSLEIGRRKKMKEKLKKEAVKEIKVKTLAEAEKLLRLNSSKEQLNKLAQLADEETLQLLIAAATSMSWSKKDTNLSSFVLANRKK